MFSVVSGEETSDLRPAALPGGAMSVSEGERQQERQQAVKRSHETPGQAQERQEQDTAAKKLKQDLTNLPTRQYLDQTVVPILLQVINYNVGLGRNEIVVGPRQPGKGAAEGPHRVSGGISDETQAGVRDRQGQAVDRE